MRRHFAEGIGVFALLIFLSLWISSIPYSPLEGDGYTPVDPNVLVANPSIYEDSAISTSITITDSYQIGNDSYFESEEGIVIVFQSGHPSLSSGDRVLLRGISQIQSRSYFVVEEFYVLDTSSSIIRSIPGIIIFLVLFFSVYTFDTKKLEFHTRGDSSA